MTTKDPRLVHVECGQAAKPALIFLHGFPFDHTMWENQMALCAPYFRVIAYDHRGHGRSEVGQSPYFFEFFVDDLFRLMEQLAIEKAILCGLSMGGYLALRAVERHPKKILGLVLCDTRSEADGNETKIKRAADLRLIQEQGLPVFAEKFLKAIFTASTIQKQPAVVESIWRVILASPVQGVCNTLAALATRTDTTASLSALRVPTLIMAGAEDPITPPSAAENMHRLIAHSHRHHPGSGPYEQSGKSHGL